MRRGQGTGTGLRGYRTSHPPRPRPPAHLRAGARGRGANGGCCAHARTASASAGASASASRALTCVDHHVMRAATTAPCATCSALSAGGEPRPAPRAPPTSASQSWPRSTRGATVLKEQQCLPVVRRSPPFWAFHDDMMRDGKSGNPQCDRRGGHVRRWSLAAAPAPRFTSISISHHNAHINASPAA